MSYESPWTKIQFNTGDHNMTETEKEIGKIIDATHEAIERDGMSSVDRHMDSAYKKLVGIITSAKADLLDRVNKAVGGV